MGRLSEIESSDSSEINYLSSPSPSTRSSLKLKFLKINGVYTIQDSKRELIIKKAAKSLLFYSIIPKIARRICKANKTSVNDMQNEDEDLAESETGRQLRARTAKSATFSKYFEESYEDDSETSSSYSDTKSGTKSRVRKRKRKTVVRKIKRKNSKKDNADFISKTSSLSAASTIPYNSNSECSNWFNSSQEDFSDEKVI